MSQKDYIEKDYYKVLGVSKGASADEIKKAFRKIARDNHPDAHPGDKAAEQRFKDASEAHSVLSDPAKRKEYDEMRGLLGAGGPFRNFGRPGAGPTNLDDLFARTNLGGDGGLGDLFGGLFSARGQAQTRGRGPRRGADVEGETSISFLQAVEGTTVSLQLVSDEACGTCHGTGARPGSNPTVCTTCQGSGMQTSTQGGVFAVSEPCRDCQGRGMRNEDPCLECHGSGRGRNARTIQVRIPAGVTDGSRIRLKGKGAAGSDGGPAGDLYVVVHVADHDTFGRQGDDLTIGLPVTFVEASLGATVEVPTLNGPSVKVRIPAGTPNGRTLRVRGKGVRRADGSSGDLRVTVEIAVPSSINAEAEAALRAYAEATADFQPRAER